VPRIGGTERKIADTDQPHLPDRLVAWSSDSKSLIVSDREAPDEPHSLFVISIETGEKRRLTTPPQGFTADTGPALSSDGRVLVFTRRRSWGVSDLFTLGVSDDLAPQGEAQQLTSRVRMANYATWTPDDREIIFCSGAWHCASLWRMPVDGSREPARLPFGDYGAYFPAVSRQGRRFAYVQNSWDPNLWRIEMAAPGAAAGPPEPFLHSTRVESSPQYSPDGRMIAFSSERSGTREIWVADSDGSRLRKGTALGPYFGGMQPRWSPDSEWISFSSNAEGNHEMYLLAAETGAMRRLTNHSAEDRNPRWSADGEWIYFESDRGGESRIWRVASEGGEPIVTNHRQLGKPFIGKGPIYYSKGDYDRYSLWRSSIDGATGTQVLDRMGRGDFAVTRDGIYFIGTEGPGRPWSLSFFEFATKRTKDITPVKRGTGGGLTASPDGQYVIYVQSDTVGGAEIMLVENFR
jgi:Tol biopolymer transport system component